MAELEKKICILYVDDELPNLVAFHANFRRDYEIHIAESADKAFELLQTIEPHIVISDQRMPGMTGVDFFEKLISIYPDPTRILLTAYTNSQTVIDAVNKGQIDKYLVKPWDKTILQSAFRTSYTIYQSRVELRNKNEELKRTNYELNRFVYSVSHDLRAPLMSMLGLINLVRVEENPEDQKQFFDLMEKSVHKMDTYIQNTLEYYRNFKSEIRIEPVHIESMVKDIIESVSTYHSKASIKYSCKGSSEIHSDKMRMKICLSNIISNALKYGQTDSENYEVIVECNHDGNELEIKVQDFGIGISDSEKPKIYGMFYRSPQNKNSNNTGLGLYLVKEAIKRIKGRIEVESEVGKGSVFKLIIPNQKE